MHPTAQLTENMKVYKRNIAAGVSGLCGTPSPTEQPSQIRWALYHICFLVVVKENSKQNGDSLKNMQMGIQTPDFRLCLPLTGYVSSGNALNLCRNSSATSKSELDACCGPSGTGAL